MPETLGVFDAFAKSAPEPTTAAATTAASITALSVPTAPQPPPFIEADHPTPSPPSYVAAAPAIEGVYDAVMTLPRTMPRMYPAAPIAFGWLRKHCPGLPNIKAWKTALSFAKANVTGEEFEVREVRCPIYQAWLYRLEVRESWLRRGSISVARTDQTQPLKGMHGTTCEGATRILGEKKMRGSQQHPQIYFKGCTGGSTIEHALWCVQNMKKHYKNLSGVLVELDMYGEVIRSQANPDEYAATG
jgi:hypothetical protein